MRSASTTRRSAGSSFESRSPRSRYVGSRITAAATTHPNNDPRPTSSTPATRTAPDSHAFFSKRNVQRSFFSKRNLAAEADSGRTGDALSADFISKARSVLIFTDQAQSCKQRFELSLLKTISSLRHSEPHQTPELVIPSAARNLPSQACHSERSEESAVLRFVIPSAARKLLSRRHHIPPHVGN